MRWLALLTAFALLTAPQVATQSTTADQAAPSVLATGISVPTVAVDAPKSFDEWLADLRTRRAAKASATALIEETLAGLSRSSASSRATAARPSSTPASRDTRARRITKSMVTRGRDQMRRAQDAAPPHRAASSASSARVLVAIWGMETRYGRIQGTTPVFQALATLAWEPRRATYFRGELFNALTMVQRGHIEAGTMTGSWAGAMGQTQFMPSSYLKYAVDFDGDGRRDIWKSTPDALASMANYLKGYGWKATRRGAARSRSAPPRVKRSPNRSRSAPKAATRSAT